LRDGAGPVSKATVYNTLKLFVERKLIREVIAGPGRVFYDPNTEPHHHFYDVDTGELTDIDARAIEVTGLPPLPPGAVAEGVDGEACGSIKGGCRTDAVKITGRPGLSCKRRHSAVERDATDHLVVDVAHL
jgi:hypothetical protein